MVLKICRYISPHLDTLSTDGQHSGLQLLSLRVDVQVRSLQEDNRLLNEVGKTPTAEDLETLNLQEPVHVYKNNSDQT